MQAEISADGRSSGTRVAAAEQIAIAASGLARKAAASGLNGLADLIESVVIEAWREACKSNEIGPAPGGQEEAGP